MKKEKFEYIEGVESEAPLSVMMMSFLYALVFGACSLFPWMELKDLMPILALALGMPNQRATGAIYIWSTIVFGVLAFAMFSLLWHKLEKHFSHPRSIKLTLIWSAVAAAIGFLCILTKSLL